MDGSERRYEYALCSEYGSSWKCTETLGAEHVIVSGNSTRTVHYYAENGDEIATDHLIHVSSDFVSVDFQQMTYDHSHRVIRTDYANGLAFLGGMELYRSSVGNGCTRLADSLYL